MGHPCGGMSQGSISFYDWSMLHYIEKKHIFAILFSHWQTSVLSSLLGCKEHLSNVLCRPVVSFLLGMYLDTYIFSNGPAGSYDDALINFLRNCWTVSQSGYTIYIPTSSVYLSFLTSCTCYCVFLIIGILVGVKWYLVVLIGFSLIWWWTSLVCFLVICPIFKIVCHFVTFS